MKVRDGFAGGLATGAIATLLMCWFLDSGVKVAIERNVVQFITIGTTLVAAAIAYMAVLRQLRHQDDVENDLRARRLEAERAALPIALSRLAEICKRGMQDLIGHEHITSPLASENMALETTHIAAIKSMIMVSEDPIRERLQFLLVGYQLAMASVDWEFDSEIKQVPTDQSPDGYNRISLCYRWALLYNVAMSLYTFARSGQKSVAPLFEDNRCLAAVRNSGAWPESFTDFIGFFERAEQRDSNRSLSEKYFD